MSWPAAVLWVLMIAAVLSRGPSLLYLLMITGAFGSLQMLPFNGGVNLLPQSACAALFVCKALIQRGNIDKITVKALIEECHISRQTFYYHFQDLMDVIEWTMRQTTRQLSEESRKQSREIIEHYEQKLLDWQNEKKQQLSELREEINELRSQLQQKDTEIEQLKIDKLNRDWIVRKPHLKFYHDLENENVALREEVRRLRENEGKHQAAGEVMERLLQSQRNDMEFIGGKRKRTD